MNTSAEIPPYDSYKSSGIDWIGDIPFDWRILRLKDTISGCVNGVWGKDPTGSGDTIVLRVADFDRGKLVISDEKLTLRNIARSDIENRSLEKGDLLIEKSGGGDKTLVGCVVKFDKDYEAVSSNFVGKMTPVLDYDFSYLVYVFFCLYSKHKLLVNQTDYRDSKP